MNDDRILRDRTQAAREAIDSAASGDEARGSGALIGITTTVISYPTTAAVMFAIIPQDVNGSEQEGAAASYVPRSDSVTYALNLGTQVPPVGTEIICHAVGGRWCFRYDG